jgi:hypothetical protein
LKIKARSAPMPKLSLGPNRTRYRIDVGRAHWAKLCRSFLKLLNEAVFLLSFGRVHPGWRPVHHIWMKIPIPHTSSSLTRQVTMRVSAKNRLRTKNSRRHRPGPAARSCFAALGAAGGVKQTRLLRWFWAVVLFLRPIRAVFRRPAPGRTIRVPVPMTPSRKVPPLAPAPAGGGSFRRSWVAPSQGSTFRSKQLMRMTHPPFS